MFRRYAFVALIFLASCAGREKARLAPPDPEVVQKIAAADTLSRIGCYVTLKEAFGILSGLYPRPEYRDLVAARLVKNSLLLAIREKELGMASRKFMDTALAVIKENADLQSYVPYAEIAGFSWVQGQGVMRDIDERFASKFTEENLKTMDAELREKAKVDEFSAYMYATLKCFLSSSSDIREEPSELAALFPDSLLLTYREATCPGEDEEVLSLILAQEPRFYEAAYYLGRLSLSRGNFLQAEGQFLRMRQGIPESPQATILLASIALALEEVERSLEFYEMTLAIVPDYRDALLGKAICLSYLNRPMEAIAVCERIIGLGYWLLGESYYWMAWNQHELKDNAAAEANVEQSKGRLPTSSEVFTLSGIIASEMGNTAKAEKDFFEALRYNPANSEVLFNLGRLYAAKEDWPNSGLYFEKAGFSFEKEGRSLEDKIAQVEKSTLVPERKDRLLKKKKSQLERTLLTRATAFYNAAAGYFNTGQKYKALEMATRSAEHPAFKQKAGELVSGIK